MNSYWCTPEDNRSIDLAGFVPEMCLYAAQDRASPCTTCIFSWLVVSHVEGSGCFLLFRLRKSEVICLVQLAAHVVAAWQGNAAALDSDACLFENFLLSGCDQSMDWYSPIYVRLVSFSPVATPIVRVRGLG